MENTDLTLSNAKDNGFPLQDILNDQVPFPLVITAISPAHLPSFLITNYSVHLSPSKWNKHKAWAEWVRVSYPLATVVDPGLGM